jgi:hypothetical protein
VSAHGMPSLGQDSRRCALVARDMVQYMLANAPTSAPS